MIDWDAFQQISSGAQSLARGAASPTQTSAPAPVIPPSKVSTDIANTMSGLGVEQWGGVGPQYAQDVLQMEAAGRTNVGRITLPPGVGPQDFLTLLSDGEAFAASAGWRYAPTAQMYDQMMQQGLFTADQSAVFQWLARVNGVSDKMPWAAAGLTHTQYNTQKESIADVIGEYAGDRNAFSDLQQQAISNRWSSQHVIQELTNNPKYSQTSPWLKFGMTFQSFKDYKRQNKALAAQQFGPNVSDTQFAQMYEEAAQSRRESGSAISVQQGGSNALVSRGAQSQVR